MERYNEDLTVVMVITHSTKCCDDLKIKVKNHDFLSESAKIEIAIFAKS